MRDLGSNHVTGDGQLEAKKKIRMKRDRQTDKPTPGHNDSMIESAQWANSMKIGIYITRSIYMPLLENFIDVLCCFAFWWCSESNLHIINLIYDN